MHDFDPELTRLATRLRRMREERGQTMDELAAASALSKAYLSRLESGDRQPSVAAIFALARAWDVPPARLFEDRGERTTARVLREATAEWEGDENGQGVISVGSGTVKGLYSQKTRNEGAGINPEELIGAAHAGCFTMKLVSLLTGAGHPPKGVSTDATVHGEFGLDGFRITRIELQTRAGVERLSEAALMDFAQRAKRTCTVSRALTGVEISVRAELTS